MTVASSLTQSAPIQRSRSEAPAADAAPSGKSRVVAGAGSFAEGESRLVPPENQRPAGGVVQAKTEPGAAAGTSAAKGDAAAEEAGAAVGGDAKDGGAKPSAAAKGDPAERDKLDAAGKAALAALPETSAADAGNTPGNVGQGDVDSVGVLPDWFMEIQNRLVASTTWGEAEENAQHAIRDYAMYLARAYAGPDGKVPGHIKVFFDYIGRGTKNDSAAKKAGYKGSSALNGAKGAKNWCAGAATQAQRIAKQEGRDGVLADLRARGLEPSLMPVLFFNNLAALSGSQKEKFFYNDAAFAEPLEPGDRVDYLFDHCQYGGHAVHIVADLGDAFLHVSGNTTRHSAVATGQAKRLKSKPAGLNMGTATNIASDETKKKASAHIATVDFGGAKLVYSITRHSSAYKALEMLETEDPAAFEAALKKLYLKRVKGGPVDEAPKKPDAGAASAG